MKLLDVLIAVDEDPTAPLLLTDAVDAKLSVV
jgi:hypothetical protein